MNPWLESLGVAALAGAGILLGRWCSRLPKSYWLLGYVIPLSLILLYASATRYPPLAFIPPVSWMMMGRIKFAIMGFIGTLVLTTPLCRLPQRRDRIAVVLLMICVVGQASVWPFLAPAFNRAHLASLRTNLDADGVCLQSNEYNCGPAAAVTALRKLGLPAEEGEIAILAHTSSATGTPPDVLAHSLQRRYAGQGLTAEYRLFRNTAELKGAGLVLAVVKFSFMLDHYVTILDVSDKEIIVGDPLTGKTALSHEQFRQKWRFSGVVLKRKA